LDDGSDEGSGTIALGDAHIEADDNIKEYTDKGSSKGRDGDVKLDKAKESELSPDLDASSEESFEFNDQGGEERGKDLDGNTAVGACSRDDIERGLEFDPGSNKHGDYVRIAAVAEDGNGNRARGASRAPRNDIAGDDASVTAGELNRFFNGCRGGHSEETEG